jgi:hypothetical protein
MCATSRLCPAAPRTAPSQTWTCSPPRSRRAAGAAGKRRAGALVLMLLPPASSRPEIAL